jgi:hypothetical protein
MLMICKKDSRGLRDGTTVAEGEAIFIAGNVDKNLYGFVLAPKKYKLFAAICPCC